MDNTEIELRESYNAKGEKVMVKMYTEDQISDLDQITEMLRSPIGCPNIHSYLPKTKEFADTLAFVKFGYQVLEGTEKQVEWATRIRESLARSLTYTLLHKGLQDSIFAENIANDGRGRIPAHHAVLHFMPFQSEGYEAARKYARLVCAQKTAKWYIDNRDNDQSDAMRKKAREASNQIKP